MDITRQAFFKFLTLVPEFILNTLLIHIGIDKQGTVELVLSCHSKIDKTKILMTNGSLIKVESIAGCCNTFDLH